MAHATPFRQAQEEVSRLLHKRVVIGHALRNDLKALLLTHPRQLIRDTAMYLPFQACGDDAHALNGTHDAM